MKISITITITMCVALLALTGPSVAGDGVTVGDQAPAFTLFDTAGNEVSVSDYEGKVVVLEWLNPDCPFVQRHYKAGTMKDLATKYGAQGVVWLTINSTKYMDGAANAKFRAANDLPYPILVDQSGQVGHLYGAMTTPHMYVIDGGGRLVYMGAIDDDPRGNTDGPANNYVAAALDEVLANKVVTTAETKPYGCSVKYKK
jgi:peroxiredoxin